MNDTKHVTKRQEFRGENMMQIYSQILNEERRDELKSKLIAVWIYINMHQENRPLLFWDKYKTSHMKIRR